MNVVICGADLRWDGCRWDGGRWGVRRRCDWIGGFSDSVVSVKVLDDQLAQKLAKLSTKVKLVLYGSRTQNTPDSI